MKDPNRTRNYIYHSDQRLPLQRTAYRRSSWPLTTITIAGFILAIILERIYG